MTAPNEKFKAQEVIGALRATKGNISAAASMLRCTRQTVTNYVNNYPTVKQALDEERESVIDAAETALYSAILDKQGWAVCFMLKTLGRSRGYTETVRVETWQDEYIKAIRAGEVDYDSICDVLGDTSLAEQLFRRAGVPVKAGES